MNLLAVRVFPAVALMVAACSSADAEQNDDPELDPLVGSEIPARTVCGATKSDAQVRGIDVSKYQTSIDWTQVKAAGISFAVARVSDGSTIVDQSFAAHYKGIGDAGLVRGAYQFFRPSQDALTQAKLFVKQINAAGGWREGDMPPMLDIEVTSSPAKKLQTGMVTWIRYVQEQLGVRPIVYTYPSISHIIGGCFLDYPLWIASYLQPDCPAMPDAWVDNSKSWTLWQYSDHGEVPGVLGPVDMNIFNGSEYDFARMRAEAVLKGTSKSLVPLSTVSCRVSSR